MRVVNIRVFIQDHKIKISIEEVEESLNDEQQDPAQIDPALLWLMGRRDTLFEYAQKYFLYDHPVRAEAALSPDLSQDVAADVEVKLVTYIFPSYVPFALDFLFVFNEYVTFLRARQITLSSSDRECVVANNDEAAQRLAELILRMEKLPAAYHPLGGVLKKFAEGKSEIMPASDTTYARKSGTERVQLIYLLQQKLLAENRNGELDKVIRDMACKARVTLFESCHGLPALTGHYDWHFTEWKLLQFAEFKLRADGRLYIPLATNPGYLEHYAEGTDNYQRIQEELEVLGKHLDLEFDCDTDFHRELIFTCACTQHLLASGLHYNKKYLQTMLLAINLTALFKQLFRLCAGFKLIGQDLTKRIMEEVYADVFQQLHVAEKQAAQTVGWMRIFNAQRIQPVDNDILPANELIYSADRFPY